MTREQLERRWLETGIGTALAVSIDNRLQGYVDELKGISMEISITLKDEKGNVVKRFRTPGNSFLLNFMKMLYAIMRATSYGGFACERIKSTERYTVEYRTIEYTREIAGIHAWAMKEDDTHGILIGNGTKEVSPNDTWLASQIKNGLGPGQMLYLASDVSSTEVSGNEAHIFLKRSFINHSGGDITVTELGVAVWNVNPSANLLIIRDLVLPFNVPNNYTLDVQYTISVSV